jgi:hypothetical protein
MAAAHLLATVLILLRLLLVRLPEQVQAEEEVVDRMAAVELVIWEKQV